MSQTIDQILNRGSNSNVAIQAPDRPDLTYAALQDLTARTKKAINQAGVGQGDRVAIVLPNGAEMATAFATIANVATTAPLNPVYRQEEYEFYLDDLGAKALVVEKGSDSDAVSAAKKLNINIIELSTSDDRAAGDFDLTCTATGTADNNASASPEDVALILHTSGTTSRPKIVPLSHNNICSSADNIAKGLQLTDNDACLNVMPLFHIHGLIAAVLATLSAGGRIYCSPGFNALKFFSWMDDAKPTWYTAVPTMHQAILSRAKRSQETIDSNPLRFIRSSSSSLPPQVMEELVQAFKAPVIEAYGMTEAAHQMASNPLTKGAQKPGSVGLPAGPEVEIMSESGDILAQGETGEIVIRGDNVTAGYENNPKANAENFTHGWFRTGDQGIKDNEGYISITGRLKEIINRGGEKISPREVDEVLMDHPAIQQCVTFAVKHPKLGEDVAAAVVLKDGQSAEEQEIRSFVGARLADFKVPKKVLLLDEIPKGATGKLQRIGLAEKLGLE